MSVTAAEIAKQDEMICDRCERRHDVVWFAPSDIWNAVMRGGDQANGDEFSFCCPICFMQLAEERGVDTTGWLVLPFDDGPVERAEQVVFEPALARACQEAEKALRGIRDEVQKPNHPITNEWYWNVVTKIHAIAAVFLAEQEKGK